MAGPAAFVFLVFSPPICGIKTDNPSQFAVEGPFADFHIECIAFTEPSHTSLGKCACAALTIAEGKSRWPANPSSPEEKLKALFVIASTENP
jgi:hypothetical protein